MVKAKNQMWGIVLFLLGLSLLILSVLYGSLILFVIGIFIYTYGCAKLDGFRGSEE